MIAAVDHGHALWTGHFSPDGSRFVTVAVGKIKVWDTATGAVIATPKLRYPVSAAGDRVAAKTAGDRVAVLDAATGTTIATLPIERMPDELALTGDGHHIAIGYGRGAAEVWDVERAVRLATLDGAHHVIASDTARVALGWSDGAPRAWNLATGASIALPVTGEFRPIGFSRDGGRVVLEQGALGAPHTVSVWDTTDGRRVSTIDGVNATPLVDPGGTYVTAMLADHSVQTFELAGDGHLGFHGDLLQQAQIDPSGHLIAGIDDQGAAILVLDARDGRVLVRWPLAHDPPHLRQDGFDPPRGTVRWSRDGKNLVAQSNRIERWNTDTELRDPRGALLDPPRIAQLVRHNVAWHVVAGTLVPALATLHGRLVRDGVALAHATLQLVFRKPADLGAGAVTWEAAAFQNKALPPLETDANGVFSREQLAPGRYTITIVAGGATRTLDRDIDVEDDALNLDLAR
jgi:WD40 repeat protein